MAAEKFHVKIVEKLSLDYPIYIDIIDQRIDQIHFVVRRVEDALIDEIIIYVTREIIQTILIKSHMHL